MKRVQILIFVSIAYFVMPNLLKGQPVTFQWAKQMGGATNDRGNSIVNDAVGNVYTTGSFEGIVDFDPGVGTFTLASAGASDVYISKLDAAGNFVWAKNIGGTLDEYGYSIALDASGNIYTSGQFYGTSDFNPGVGIFNMTASPGGGYDAFISKLDNSGNFVWAKQFGGGPSTPAYAKGIAIDASGNVYSTGLFAATVDFDPNAGVFNLTSAGGGLPDVFISKLDASGNFIWAKRIGGTDDDQAFSIALDNSGNVYTTGYFTFTVDFDPGPGSFPLSAPLARNIFISKLDGAGNFVWAKQLGNGGSAAGEGKSITIDNSGNVFTTGFFGDGDFDPGPGTSTLTSAGFDDIFISKLDVSGNFVWAKSIGGTGYDRGNSINTDVLGNVYTTGYFVNTADFDPGAGVVNLTSAGAQDGFVLKLNSAGTYVWSKIIGGPLDEYPRGISVDAFATVYTTGDFQGTSDFDPGVPVYSLTANATDIYVHKMSQCTVPSITTTASKSVFCKGNSTTLTATGATTYTWSANAGNATTASVIVSPTISTIYTVTGANGPLCMNTQTIGVTVVVPEVPNICMVTVDSASVNNEIYWDKTLYSNVDTFFIYRDTANNNYTLIGKVPKTALSFYVDTARSIGAVNGNPKIGQYYYKIAIKDTCGNIGAKSPWHKTIFITDNQGNFQINHYLIENTADPVPGLSSYVLRRDNNNTGNYTVAATIGAGSNNIVDLAYSTYSTIANWQLVTSWTTVCTPTYMKPNNNVVPAEPKSRSNVRNNRPAVGMSELIEDKNNILIYPNPASNQLTVSSLKNLKEIQLISLTGVVLYSAKAHSLKTQIDLNNIAVGIYFIKTEQENGAIYYHKIVKK